MLHRKVSLTSLIFIIPFFCFGQNVGIGVDTPQVQLHVANRFLTDTILVIDSVSTINSGRTEKITVRNGSIYARALGDTDSNKGFLLGEGDGGPAFGFVYDGSGTGGNNMAMIKEMIGGDTTPVISFLANGQVTVGDDPFPFSDSDYFEIYAPSGISPIRIRADGVTRFRINSSGTTEVIGRPGFDPLRVYANGTPKLSVSNNGGLSVGSSFDGPENGLYVVGNAGIGISTPTEKLDVNGNIRSSGTIVSTGDFIQVQDGSQSLSLVPNASEGYVKLDVGGSGHSQDHIILGEAGNGNLNKVGIGTNNPGGVISNALFEVNGGHIALENNFGIFSNNNGGTGIGAGFDTDTDDDLFLFAGGANRMTVNSSGNVGIGTSTPEYPLHIQSPGISGPTIAMVLESAVSERPLLLFSENGSSIDLNAGMSIEYDGSGGGATNKLRFNKIGGNPAMTIENGGEVGINLVSPSSALHIIQTNDDEDGGLKLEHPTNTNHWELLTGSTSNLWFNYNGVLKSYINLADGSFNNASDRNVKRDITRMTPVLEKVKQLQPSTYRYKTHPQAEKSIGFVAQEVEAFFPEVVSENKGIKGINYDAFAVIAIQAIKELANQNTLQQETIQKLEEKNDRLESRLARIEKLLSTKEIE